MAKNGKTPKAKTTNSERETRVLLEEIRQQVQTVAEGQTSSSDRLIRIETVVTELIDLKSDVGMIKTVVTDTNERVKSIEKKLDNHEKRITKLEEKVLV